VKIKILPLPLLPVYIRKMFGQQATATPVM